MKKGTGFIWVGVLLLAAALSFTIYNMWDDQRAGKSMDAVLGQLVPVMEAYGIDVDGNDDGSQKNKDNKESKDPASEEEIPDYILDPDKEMPTRDVKGLDYIGVLKIPAINAMFPIIEEWSDDNLRVAPCRYSGSVYKNDMVICAHNYQSQFGPVRGLDYGDEVIFIDMDGNRFVYEVEEVQNLLPTQVRDMKSGDWDLTLFTCTTGAAYRVAVRCRLVEQ